MSLGWFSPGQRGEEVPVSQAVGQVIHSGFQGQERLRDVALSNVHRWGFALLVTMATS